MDTLQDLESLLKSQEHTMSQLDKQRSNIVSMLQRGKQLTTESSLPVVQESVSTLESQWNKTYTKSSDALHKLKGKWYTLSGTSIANPPVLDSHKGHCVLYSAQVNTPLTIFGSLAWKGDDT